MRDEHTVICSPAVFELIAPDAPVVPVNVDLTYTSRDPYAVQASFRTGNGTAVDWVFARDLLRDGLVGPSGTGDVRVCSVSAAVTGETVAQASRRLQTAPLVLRRHSPTWVISRGRGRSKDR